MNIDQQTSYRQQLDDFLGRIQSKLLPAINTTGALAGPAPLLPSAQKRDVALVVEDTLLAVRQGLDDRQMNTVLTVSYLAQLLANALFTPAQPEWEIEYRKALTDVGWDVDTQVVLAGRDFPSLTLPAVARTIATRIGCPDAGELLEDAVSQLPQSPRAFGLLERCSLLTGKLFAINIIPVPTVTAEGNVRLGVAFVRMQTTNGTLGSLLASVFLNAFSPRLAYGFSATISLEKLTFMGPIVEEALHAVRKRQFEEIRLG